MESLKPILGNGLAAGNETHRGKFFPQPQLSNALMMDDVCGYAPILVTAMPVSTGPAGKASEIKILPAQAEPEILSCLENLGAKAALVRPDRYILGTANTKDELSALLSCGLASPLPITTKPSLR